MRTHRHRLWPGFFFVLFLLLGHSIASAQDTTPPSITPITPLAGTSATPEPLFIVSITDVTLIPPSLGSGLNAATFKMLIDGTQVNAGFTIYIDGSGVGYYQPSTPLTGGGHTITVEIEDGAGNLGTKSWAFNSVWPQFSNFQPPDGSTTNNPMPAISAQLTGGLDILSWLQDVSLKVDGQAVASTYNAGTKIVSYTPAAQLADGTHTVDVISTFAIPCGDPITCWIVGGFGNLFHLNFTITAATWTFTTATAIPDITNLTPADGSVANTSSVLISAKLLPKNGTTIDALQSIMKVNNVQVPASYDSGTNVFSYTANLSDGATTVYVKAVDSAGNFRETTWSFTVDTIVPVLTSPSPSDGSLQNSSPSSVSCSVTETGSGINASTAVVKIDGQTVSSSYDAGAKKITATPANLSDGTHTVLAQIKDNAGNVGELTWTFTIDTTPPVLSNFSPTDGALAGGNNLTISVKAVDATSGVDPSKVKITVDLFSINATYDTSTNLISAQKTLNEGPHIAYVEATDNTGNKATATWNFTVDTTPPTLTPISPVAGTSVSPRPIISAYVTDSTLLPPSLGSGVDQASIKLSIDGTLVAHKYATYIDGRGIVYYQPSTTLTGGPHTVTLEADDKGGNHVVTSWSFTSIFPEWTNFTPPEGTQTNNPQIPISAQLTTAKDGVDCVSEPEMKIDGNVVAATYDGTTRKLSYTPPSPLTDGTHTVAARLKLKINCPDPVTCWLVGQISNYFSFEFIFAESTWSFTVDTIPPQVTNFKPTEGSFVNTSSVAISAKVTDERTGIDPLSVTMKIDNGTVLPSFDEATGTVSFDANLSNGNHTVVITAKDKAGNTGQGTFTFSVDTVAPVISNVLPSEGSKLKTTPSEISAVIQDPAPSSGVNASSLVIKLDNNVLTTNFNAATGKLFATPPPLSDGNHTVTVSGKDNAGNAAEPVTSTFLVDSTPPLISITSPQDGGFGTSTPTIKGKVTDPSPGSGVNSTTVIIKIDNVPQLATFDETTGDVILDVAAPLAEGTHTVTLDAQDNAGNIGVQAKVTFTIDSEPPFITFISPFDGQQFASSPTEIKTQVIDPAPGSGLDTTTLVMKVDRNIVAAVYDSITGNFNFLLPEPLTGGAHLVAVDAKDRAGNLTAQVISFYMDNVPPTLSNCKPADGSTITSADTISCIVLDNAGGSGINTSTTTFILNNQSYPVDYNTSTGETKLKLAAPLNDGTYSATLNAYDNGGNNASASFTFTIGTPPTVTIIKPLPDTATTSNSLITLKVEDATGVDKNTANALIDDTLFLGPQDMMYDVITKILTFGRNLSAGNHTISFSVKDFGGLETTVSWSFSVDAQAPVLVEQTPASSLNTNVTPTQFVATISDGANGVGINTSPDKLYFRVFGGGSFQNVPPTNIETVDATNKTLRVTYTPTGPLVEGIYIVTLKSEDIAGNKLEVNWNLALDKTPPTITIVKPLPNALVNRADFEYTITDNLSNIDKNNITQNVFLKIDGVSQTYTFEGNVLTASLTLSNGTHQVLVTAKDRAGNEGQQGYTITLDTTLPDSAVVQPEVKDIVFTPRAVNPSQGETFTLSYTLTKKSHVVMRMVHLGPELKEGSTIKTIVDEVQEAGSHNITNVEGKDTNGNVLEDGAYKITMRAEDSVTGAVFTFPDKISQKVGITNVTSNPSFRPLANQNQKVSYTLDVPSLVLSGAGIGLGPLVRVLSFWEPRPAGDHTDVWDGRDDAGNLVDVGGYDFKGGYIPVPDNALLMIGNTPQITNTPETSLTFNAQSGETISFNYTLSEPSTMTVRVFDSFNAPVTTLENAVAKSAGVNTVSWNGRKTEDGSLAPNGTYSIAIGAVDAQGFSAHRKYVVASVRVPQYKVGEDTVFIVPNADETVSGVTEDGVVLMLREHYKEETRTVFAADVLNKTPGSHVFQGKFTNTTKGTTFNVNKTIFFVGPVNIQPKTGTILLSQNETVSFTYTLPFADKVSVYVFKKESPCALLSGIDDTSLAVRIIESEVPKAQGQNSFTWDGKDGSGMPVQPGFYDVVVLVKSPDRLYARKYFEIVTVGVQ